MSIEKIPAKAAAWATQLDCFASNIDAIRCFRAQPFGGRYMGFAVAASVYARVTECENEAAKVQRTRRGASGGGGGGGLHAELWCQLSHCVAFTLSSCVAAKERPPPGTFRGHCYGG